MQLKHKYSKGEKHNENEKENCENKYENNHENINNCENGEKKILRKTYYLEPKGELQGLLAANRRKPVIRK